MGKYTIVTQIGTEHIVQGEQGAFIGKDGDIFCVFNIVDGQQEVVYAASRPISVAREDGTERTRKASHV